MPTTSLKPIVLFQQDFEATLSNDSSWLIPNWKIISDGTGNHIYCNEKSSPWSTHNFGEDSWADYSVELRVESLDHGQEPYVSLYARFDAFGDNGYWAGLNFQTQLADLQYADKNQYTGMGQVTFPTRENTWYTMRLDAYGNHFRYYINDQLVESGEDNQRASGRADFDIGAGHQVCIDDIRVTALSTDGLVAQEPAISTTPESNLSNNSGISPLNPEVVYGNQQDGLSYEYKTGCVGDYPVLDTCFLWDLDSVTVTTPSGKVVPLQKDFNHNNYSGEDTRRWVIYGPGGSGLPENGTYVFTYTKNNNVVLVQKVVFALPKLVERPSHVVVTQNGNDLHVTWQPPQGISPEGHYKVIIGDTKTGLFVTSQIFPWDSFDVVLPNPPLVSGTSYDIGVDWGGPSGYSGSDVAKIIWSNP